MRICLFDDVAGGHHTSYVSGLVRAAVGKVDYTLAASPEPIHGLDEGTGRWLPVQSTRHRQVLAGRRVLNQVLRAARVEETELFVDLYLDKSIWMWPTVGTQPARTVHVLHHAHHYTVDSGILNRVKTRTARRLLAALVDRGDLVAVHTRRAVDVLSDFLPLNRVFQVGFPVHSPSAANGRDRSTLRPAGSRLLFVGQARVDKGADVLLSALQRLPQRISVTFVGPQEPGVRALLDSTADSSRVEWIDRFVTDAELTEQLVAADLAVLPYRSAFGFYGGASGALLSALAAGCPVVATTPLGQQLPPRYGGAVLAEPDDAQSLADGIESALSELGGLRRAAESQGPAFIYSHHSFEKYLESLLADHLAES